MRHSRKKILSIFLVLVIAISVAIIMPRHDTRADMQEAQKSAKTTEVMTTEKIKEKIQGKYAKRGFEKYSPEMLKSQLEKKIPDFNEKLKKAEAETDPKAEVRLIVQLQSAAAVTKAPIKDSQGKENFSKVQAEVNSVKNNQSSVIRQIEQITGNKVKRSYGYLINGFSITAKREDIAKIQKIPGVAKVTEASLGYFDLQYAKKLTQVYEVWEELNYKGEGMVIAVIDSGIDPNHKDLVLTESGRRAAKLKDTNPQGPGKYFSEKIPYGFNFADYNTDIIDKNPATNMHGIHVAGIIAGNADKSSSEAFKGIQGVAPEAQLLAMKVSSNRKDDIGGIYEDDIIAAIEDSVIHGADIINMSLGWYAGYQDPDSPQQIAIKNATDQGVLVVVAAGNEGTSTSDFYSGKHIQNLLDIADTGTISAPAAAKDALAVASYENIKYILGEQIHPNFDEGMSYFTSWGPAPNLGFKPEITAPGGKIYSLANDNKYQNMSGTSMAAPHVAGAQALVIQSLKAKNSNLKGRELVEFAKNLVINTAEVQMDDNNLPHSPRRQGAGMIQIKNAINNEVIVTDSKGSAAIELKEIGQTTEVTLTLKNIGNTATTYTLDKSYLMTEKADPQSKIVKSALIEGGSISLSQNSITVPANGQTTVKMTIKLPSSFAKQQFAEGFLRLKSQNKPTLTVPFMGFYGNWADMTILDVPAWEEGSKTASYTKRLFGEYFKKITPNAKTHVGTTLLGKCSWGINRLGIYGGDTEEDLYSINPDLIAFSPNGDIYNELIIPNVYFLRNAKELRVDVLNANKELVTTVGRKYNVRKELLEDEMYRIYGGLIAGTLLEDCAWDGTIYDWSTGKITKAPQGQYYIRVTAKADMPNAKEESIEMPVKLDTEPPVIELKSPKVVQNGKYKLEWTATDNLSGVDNLLITLNTTESIDMGVPITRNGNTYSCELELEENAFNNILIVVPDNAGNFAEYQAEIQVGNPEPFSFDAFIWDGMWVDKDTLDLKGKVTAEVKTLKINDKEVAIKERDGFRRFEEKINLKPGNNTVRVVAQDNEGKVIFDKSYVFKSDTEPPVITITEPKVEKDGIVYLDSNTKSVTIKGKVTDNVKVEGVVINSDSISLNDDGSFEYELEISGNTAFFIKAYDESYLTTEYEIFFVTEEEDIKNGIVDIYNLYLITVANKENTKNGVYTIEGKVREPLKVFKINDKDVKVKDDLTFTFDVALEDGLNVVKVYAENQAGEVVCEKGYKVLYDIEAPSFSIKEPTIKNDGKIYTNKDKLAIKGEVSDNTFGYTFYINGSKIAISDKYPLIGKEANKQEFTHEVPVKGNGKLTFTANDKLGNSTEVVIDVIQDKEAPKAPIFIYDNKPTNKAVLVEIKANANDKDIEAIEFSFDKEKWFVYTEPVKVDGNRKLYARVTDYAGNTTYGEVNITNINKEDSKKPNEQDKDKNDNSNTVDENGKPLPKAGSPINFKILSIAGAILIIAGAAFVFFSKKRKKSSDKIDG